MLARRPPPRPASAEPSSTLTDRYQTTIPEPVRRQLRLKKGDRLRYRVVSDREVLIEKESLDSANDPSLEPFLAFIAKDIHDVPQRLGGIDPALIRRARELTEGVAIDRDAPLDPADE
jgi:antitoxin PrlF